MKDKIHPKWFPQARVTCSCGNSFTVGATVAEIHTEICGDCHPFFTGEQRIVDTAGQVERFMRRLEVGTQQRTSVVESAEARKQAEIEARRKRRGLTPLAQRLPARAAAVAADEGEAEVVEITAEPEMAAVAEETSAVAEMAAVAAEPEIAPAEAAPAKAPRRAKAAKA